MHLSGVIRGPVLRVSFARDLDQAEVLKPFISEDLMQSTTPIFYRSKTGGRAVGYEAELLSRVGEVYLKFRDESLAEKGEVPRRYKDIITACDILMRGLAHVGIAALVDEATGYQVVRDRLALQAILDKFLEKEFAAWAKKFGDDFYNEIFRLRGWKWESLRGRRPPLVAVLTNNVVWSRLAPGLLEELKARNPKRRKRKSTRKASSILNGRCWPSGLSAAPACGYGLDEGVIKLERFSSTIEPSVS